MSVHPSLFISAIPAPSPYDNAELLNPAFVVISVKKFFSFLKSRTPVNGFSFFNISAVDASSKTGRDLGL